MAEPIPDLGVSVLSISQGFAAFSLFMPKLSVVRASTGQDMVLAHDVRMGEIAASAITLGIAGIISYATRSAAPLYIGGIVAAGFVTLYEVTLHKIRPVELAMTPTRADTSTPHVNRNESGSLRTGYPYGDEIHYDVDRNLGTMGIIGYPVGSEATVSTGEAGPLGVFESNAYHRGQNVPVADESAGY